MATTTFSSSRTDDAPRSTTRRGFLRLVGTVAAASALAAVGANRGNEPADARRSGKKRRQRHGDRSELVTTRATADPALAPDQADGDLAYAGTWCHWQIVCYPNRVCRRRKVCW